jgi:DNA-binding transcriptional ArsR family regulator
MHARAMNEIVRNQRLLACLGDRSRFRVVEELVRGERCVTDIAFQVGLSQSCTTRHLQALLREGIVHSRRMGKKVLFSLSPEPRVAALLAWAIVPSAASRRERPRAQPAIVPIARQVRPRQTYGTAPQRPTGSEAPGMSAEPTDRDSILEPSPARARTEELEDFLL